MELILARLGEAGYEWIETMFGNPPRDRECLDRMGVSCYATHIALSLLPDLGDLTNFCHQMDAKVVCISGLLQWNERGADDYRRSADALNTLGHHLNDEGLTLQYHNHEFEFALVEGEATGMDLLLFGLDPEVVSLCVDAGWASLAGHDPVAFMLQHPDRIGTVHLRDFKGAKSVPLGRGDLDLKSTIAVLPKLPSAQVVLVEQDPGTADPVGDMIGSLRFLEGIL